MRLCGAMTTENAADCELYETLETAIAQRPQRVGFEPDPESALEKLIIMIREELDRRAARRRSVS